MCASVSRDEFPNGVVRILQERVANRCSNPGCGCATSGPNFSPTKATRIGVAAHITAAAQNGPRYDSRLTAEQRTSIENGIWLCHNCSRLIDADPITYSIQVLVSWKTQAEAWARTALETRSAEPVKRPGELGWICPYCGTTVVHGIQVCLGCKAEVVYGATRVERENAGRIGLLAGGMLAAMALFALPDWLRTSFDWNVSAGWGLGLVAVVPIGISAVLAAYTCITFEERSRRATVPRFFRDSIT